MTAIATETRDRAKVGVASRRVDWLNAVGIGTYHLVALLALMPWFFSWTGVAICVLGTYVYGSLGIGICYHRLLTHRSFVCPKWLEHSLAVIAICAFQDTPTRWVAVHRRHHEHADEPPDPHSPIVSFLWAHVGWLLLIGDDMERMHIYSRYARDIVRDPFYRRVDKPAVYLGIIIASWFVYFGAGFLVSLAAGGSAGEAVQFGSSLLIWGVFLRTVIVWHTTWSVNSVTHIWGYRNYETDEDSTNNVLVGLLSNGEGWHNNHHADPRSARHGHKWWEFDLTYLTIRLFGFLGLARDIVEPSQHRLAGLEQPPRVDAG